MGATEGFWQRSDYENVPSYCKHCWHVGHSESACYVHNPDLKAVTAARSEVIRKGICQKVIGPCLI